MNIANSGCERRNEMLTEAVAIPVLETGWPLKNEVKTDG
jgi:hypothetical protein